MRWFVLLTLVLICCPASGASTDLEFSQHLAAPLPSWLVLDDEAGRAVRLGDYFGTEPLVLVLGYFECPNLCSTVLEGVIESLAVTRPARHFRLLAVSIDPREGPSAAQAKLSAHRAALAGMDAHFLTGRASVRLADAVGFPYAWDEEHGQYVHPAGFVVATPDGRIARYFLGVRFDPKEVRQALGEAAAGRTGSLADRLLLLCAHFDPSTGRYSGAVMAALRFVCLLLAGCLGLWIWRRRAGRAP